MRVRALRPRRLALLGAVVVATVAVPLSAWALEDGGDDPPASSAIVGGTVAPPGAYPFVVGILYGEHRESFGPYETQYCGGTVVASTWVLTAAHCVVDASGQPKAPADIDVWVGSSQLVPGTGQRRTAVQVVVHPEYLATRAANPGQSGPWPDDVALLRVAAPLGVPTVALAAPGDPGTAPGSLATAVGWGKTGTSSYPHDLHHVELTVVADDDPNPSAVDCRAVTGPRFVASDMLCAGHFGADACAGDSGGPLLSRRGTSWVQIGITSYGADPCGYLPGGYAEVGTYAAWIRSWTDPPPPTTTTTTTPSTPPTIPPGDRNNRPPGYWMLGADCAVYNFGAAQRHDPVGSGASASTGCVAITATDDGRGFWVLDRNGQVHAYGNAPALPSPNLDGAQPAGIAATATGQGYWVADSRGNVYTAGDAPYHGGVGHLPLNQPIIGMATAPDGSGYWLVASDGGVFAFGDAPFFGSTGHMVLNKPVNGLSRTPSGQGYWMVASDGGVFAFGDASFVGSLGANPPASPVIGFEPSF